MSQIVSAGEHGANRKIPARRRHIGLRDSRTRPESRFEPPSPSPHLPHWCPPGRDPGRPSLRDVGGAPTHITAIRAHGEGGGGEVVEVGHVTSDDADRGESASSWRRCAARGRRTDRPAGARCPVPWAWPVPVRWRPARHRRVRASTRLDPAWRTSVVVSVLSGQLRKKRGSASPHPHV